MTETMYIGSGDVHALMSGKDTKSHIALMQRFVSGVKPYYNAFASPIDALRTGAILENRYLLTLPDNYFAQYVVRSDEMDVFKCSIDFARIDKGKLTDFDELKTLYLSDYLDFIEPIKHDNRALVEYVRKKHKAYYYQVQEQLDGAGKLREGNAVHAVLAQAEHRKGDVKQSRLRLHARERHEHYVGGYAEYAEVSDEIRDRPKFFFVDLSHSLIRHNSPSGSVVLPPLYHARAHM